MARDLFVYWQDKKPTKEVFELVLKNYLGEIGTVEFNNKRGTCSLPGKLTHPFKDVPGFPQEVCVAAQETPERWFEVFWHTGETNTIDIITRQQDYFTNVVATGLADPCVQYWKAKKEDD